MNTIKELDAVALTCDLPEHGLKRGDVGTAVLVHGDGEAFEVEFVGYDGHTGALVTLEHAHVRPLRASDIPPTPASWPQRSSALFPGSRGSTSWFCLMGFRRHTTGTRKNIAFGVFVRSSSQNG